MDDTGLLPGLLTFALLAVFGSLVLTSTSGSAGVRAFQTRLFLTAFLVRFVVSIAIYQFGLIRIVKDEDGSGWMVGLAWKNAWLAEGRSVADLPASVFEAYTLHHKGHYFLLAWFFLVTGLEGRLVAAALNGFFGAATAVLTYRTARALLPDRAATWVGWYTCLFPSLILWSAQTIKEPVVICLEAAALYGSVRLRTAGFHPKYAALCVAAIVLLVPFRFYAAYVAIVTVLGGLVVPGRGGGRQAPRLVAAAGVAVGLSLFGGFLRQETASQVMDLEYVEKFRRAAAEGQGSGVHVEVDMRTTVGQGTAFLVGVVHLLLAPFPWQWFGGIRTILVAPEVVYWWWLLVRYVVPGLRYLVRARRLPEFAPILLFVLLMAVLYSMMFSNVGLAYRQRAQLLPWVFIIAAVGREVRAAPARLAAGRVGVLPARPEPRSGHRPGAD